MIEHLQDAESQILKAQDELEQRVIDRTSELSKANASLHREVEQRKYAEKALRESEL
jgi:C4-dicarboxylate-specific signal transduction histidine kinase